MPCRPDGASCSLRARRSGLGDFAGSGGGPRERPLRAGPHAVAPFELDELTIADLQAGMSSGKFSCRSLTQKYIDRIEAVDRRGPALNSIIELNPDALAIAESWTRNAKLEARAARCTEFRC